MFKVGDRVIKSTWDELRPFKRGKINRVYSSTPSGTGQKCIMYSVMWDGETVEDHGYIEGGQLRPEPTILATPFFPETRS